MILLEPKLERIGDALMECACCGWEGTVYKCEPDVDGDGALGCPICCTGGCNPISIVHDKVAYFELTLQRLSNYDIQVIFNGQFLMQFVHDEKHPEYYIAQDLRDVALVIEQLSIIGKEASEAAKIIRKKAKQEFVCHV